MYQGFACHQNWDWDTLNYTPSEYGRPPPPAVRCTCPPDAPPLTLRSSGGLHHAAVRVSGEKVYRRLKHEGGTHRVQRIPEVGLSSRMQRIHTGTMTVIVLPQPVEVPDL